MQATAKRDVGGKVKSWTESPIAADIKPTVEEIVTLCRSELEVMFNLQYLFMVDAHSPDKVRAYAQLMRKHLERMESILLAKLGPPGST
jgi:hypothetical protein